MMIATRLSSSWLLRSFVDPQCGHFMALSLRSAPAELGSRARDPAASSLRPAIAVDRQSRKRPSRIWEPGSATGITPTTDFGLRHVTRWLATRVLFVD